MPSAAHAFDVLGVGLFADEDALSAGLGRGHRRVGGVDDLAAGPAGAGGQTLGEQRGALLGRRVHNRVQQLVKLHGATRVTAIDSSIRPSSSISIAMFNAAVPVRLPLRHWSM